MTDVQNTWKKHGWVPPSQQEVYTLYWERVKNPPPRTKIPEIHILSAEMDNKMTKSLKNIQTIFNDLHKYDCRL